MISSLANPHWDRNTEIVTCRRWGMTYREIGDLYGLSCTRVMQIVYVRERWERSHSLPPEEHAKRLKARYLFAVLPKIEWAAKRAARKWRPDLPRLPRQPHRPQPRREVHSPPGGGVWWPERYGPRIADWQRMTQDELHAVARTIHWTRVVYEAGTDRIVRIQNW